MAIHTLTTTDRTPSAHRRGGVGAVGAVVGLALAVAAVIGVGAAATTATWEDGAYLGPTDWQVSLGVDSH